MGQGIGDIFKLLTAMLPPWALALLVVVVLVLALPGWNYSTRTKQVKNAVRRMVRAAPGERESLRARAFERAGEDAHLLALVAREARKRSLPRVYDEALRRLDAHSTLSSEADKVRAEVAAPKLEPLHADEVVIRVQALLDEGAVLAARSRLLEALQQHPEHAELQALLQRASAPPET